MDILAASALLDMMKNGVWEDGPQNGHWGLQRDLHQGLQQDLEQDLMDLQEDLDLDLQEERELRMGRRRRAEKRREDARRGVELQQEHLRDEDQRRCRQVQNVPDATHGREGKPGRPPKSDDGAVWCVQFKRAVATAKPTARVGLKEAIDAFHAFHADQGTTLSLATVRKRVENLYGVTWSKVASRECPETHKKPTCEGVEDMAVKYVEDQ